MLSGRSRAFVFRSTLTRNTRYFSVTRSTYIDVKSHNSLNDTLNCLRENGDTDPDLKSGQTYHDIINHHASRVEKLPKEEVIEKEYDDLYMLSLTLLKLLENTPEVSQEYKKEILNNLIREILSIQLRCRVDSSWSLYHKLKPEEPHDIIAISALKKLLYGDSVEIKENLHKVDIKKLIQILQIYETVGDKSLIDDKTYLCLMDNLIKLSCTAIVTSMYIPPAIIETLINENDGTPLNNIDYLYLYEASINNGVSLSGNALLKTLMPISKLQLTPIVDSENLKLVKSELGVEIKDLAPLSGIVEEIREQILELGLDDTPEMMNNLIRSAGFYSNDLKAAIKYFQNYQTKVPDGTVAQNNLKSIISLVCTYDCIVKEDKKMINVAEVLVPQTPLPAANNLAALMLFHGWFNNSDKAIDIHNKAINLFLKPHEGNEYNRGVLTQSLVLVCLLDKDVELARLIKQRGSENNTLDESFEIRLSNLMKEYGDIIEESKSDDEFRKEMKRIFLRTIREWSP
ncbi:unnamed protein product [Pichia kudriavzevii]